MNRLLLILACGIAAVVTDPRSTLPGTPKRGADGKLHGVPGNTEGPKRCWIDHVFYTPGSIHATRQSVVIDQDALDASDHSPVVVDFELR